MTDRLATITAELNAAFGRRVDDVVAAALAEEAATTANHAKDEFYVLVPDLFDEGVYTAVFSDGSSVRGWVPAAA